MVELAEIFRDAGPAYLQRFGDRMLPSHKRVMQNIIDCRTPALGGEMYVCPRCELEHSVYHSCRDRHCPKCQGHEAERWLEKQRKLLLPCSYGFATFTVPAGLREVARSHQLVVYPILIRAAALALLEVAGDRRFVGGLTGVMAVLHTWARTLIFHLHVHIVFPVGGLGEDGDSWVKSRTRNYILPKGFVKVRYYGLWASASRDKLEKARSILKDHHAAIGKKPLQSAIAGPAPRRTPRCPKCGCEYDRSPVTIPRSREPP